jgi:hypothetical protein
LSFLRVFSSLCFSTVTVPFARHSSSKDRLVFR